MVLLLLGQTVVLQFDKEVVAAEDVLEAGGQLGRLLGLFVEEGLEHDAAEAAGGGDDAVVVGLEELPVETGLVEVALEVGPRRQLEQVLVALVGLGQQRQVVVELLAPLAVASGVVDAPAANGALGAALGRHVGLDADDGVDALRRWQAL